MDDKKKLQSGWNINYDNLKSIGTKKSEADIEEIENDLKKTGDWETYYERMYEKTGSDKYKKKFAELISLRIKLESELKGASQVGFEETFAKVLGERIKKDLDDQIAIDGARGGSKQVLKIGDEEIEVKDIKISISATGKVKNIDGKKVIDDVSDVKIDKVE